MADLLIEAGADVNHVSEQEWTPLMEAAASGEAEMVDRLIAAGADPRFTNSKEQSAEAAARYGGFEALANHIASL